MATHQDGAQTLLAACTPTQEEVAQLAARPDRTATLVAISTPPHDCGEETPTTAFLKMRSPLHRLHEGADKKGHGMSFLWEVSEKNNPVVLRHSIISTEPWKVLRTGPGLDHQGDPLLPLQRELAHHRVPENIYYIFLEKIFNRKTNFQTTLPFYSI